MNIIGICIALIFLAGLVSAVPQAINIEGKLKDDSGNVLSGKYSINFSIYDAYTSGNLLWNSYSVTTES